MNDWRNAANYPGPKTPLKQWAWELLRRNKEYRNDFRRYIDCCAELRAAYGSKIEEAHREPTEFAFCHDDPRGCVYDPPREDGECEEDWLRRVGKGLRTPLAAWLCKKWGIAGADAIPNPSTSSFQCSWASPRGGMVTFVGHGWRRTEDIAPPGFEVKPAVQFDLSLPIGPQLVYARRALQGRQKALISKGIIGNATGRAQSGKLYQRYVRTLDAREAFATIADIGATLFPRDSNEYPIYPRDRKVKAMIKVAEELRDGGYLRLPAFAGVTTKK